MRIKKVHEKKLETVLLPPRLVTFLKQTYQSILKKEDAALMESDDMLQDTFVYGGLLKRGEDKYSFVYFPAASGVKDKWEFILNTNEIKNITEGGTTTLDLWACTQDNCQSKFMDKTETCFYHDYCDDGKPYPNQLSPEETEKLKKETQAVKEQLARLGVRPFRS